MPHLDIDKVSAFTSFNNFSYPQLKKNRSGAIQGKIYVRCNKEGKWFYHQFSKIGLFFYRLGLWQQEFNRRKWVIYLNEDGLKNAKRNQFRNKIDGLFCRLTQQKTLLNPKHDLSFPNTPTTPSPTTPSPKIPPSNPSAPIKKPLEYQTHMAPDPSDLKKCQEDLEKHKQAALQRLHEKKTRCDTTKFSLSSDQKSLLEKALKTKLSVGILPPPGVTKIHGGQATVFFLNSLPNLVVKYIRAQGKAEEYVKRSNEARTLIQQRNLYLLNVPEAQTVTIGSDTVVLERRARVLGGDYTYQKGLHQAFLDDKDLKIQEFMKTGYEQKGILINEFEFSDVKFDNLLLSLDGCFELIDLDKNSKMQGFIGLAGTSDGLFHYLPIEWIDEFKDKFKASFIGQDRIDFVKEVEDIKEKKEQAQAKETEYNQYLDAKGVKISSQQLDQSVVDSLFKDPIEKECAKILVQTINDFLKENLTLQRKIQRTATIELRKHEEFTKECQAIFDNDPYSSFNLDTFRSQFMPKLVKTLCDTSHGKNIFFDATTTNLTGIPQGLITIRC